MTGSSIANIGTFDIENFGDLLFPEILKRGLSKRIDLEYISLFSPTGGPKPFEPNIRVQPITNFDAEHNKHKFNAVILGGGDLFRLDTSISEFYTQRMTPATQLLWNVSTFAEKHSIPVIWNSIGVPFQFRFENERTLVREYCNHIKYLAVRDHRSKNFLLDAGVDREILVVPDTAVALSKYFDKNALVRHFSKLNKEIGLDIERDFLIFQSSPGFVWGEENIKWVADILLSIKLKYHLEIVLLPIGYCHNDGMTLERINRVHPHRFHYIENKLSPIDILSTLVSSQFFIGSSLHGNITAYSYGIGHISINTANLVKLNGFFDLINELDFSLKSLLNLDAAFDRKMNPTLPNPKEQQNKIRDDLINQVEQHFNQVAQIITQVTF
ncbi:polysaccharide pyruvyl transferase family protein [Cohnella sp.]|uniref:polysaccharide pyruvyl transferase family protein n=1 Tax=Cohnella sp. TaxID=1883426 RepID=UPI0035661DE4